jgi:hypothetical protein
MTYLPASAQVELVTKSDFDAFRSEFDSFRSEVNSRFDRLFLTLVAGLFTIVAAMAGFLIVLL